MSLYTIYGGLGSPYSMKMRAILRYRQIPYVWKQADGGENIFKHVKAPVIPVIQFPDGSWHNDSTPMIFELERRVKDRSIIPADPAWAFLAYLLEDFADEWGTKAMFHYRWFRERDQKQMAEWLAFDRLKGKGRETILKAAKVFRDRQVGRMPIVGCTLENAPIIEESAKRILALFEAHVTEELFLFGSQPSLADFGWLGQLSQLAVDPTPQDLMRAEYPFTFRWLANLDDASGLEGEWRDPDAPLADAVTGLLKLAGEVYFPFLLANAEAVSKKEDTLAVEMLGRTYTQGAFRYQVKCLAELRWAFSQLDPDSKRRQPLFSIRLAASNRWEAELGRKILFITTDQQRFDSLGVNGNKFCRTPNIDALAKAGINYTRAYNQNTVCMPARSTMLTGQYVRTHGVFSNGVALPETAPSVAKFLKEKAGYKTALVGKAHFEPAFDTTGKWEENRRQMTGDFGPWRGFDYAIHAMHVANFRGQPVGHYGRWVQKNFPEYFNSAPPLLNASGGGDTNAPETSNNAMPREAYHTDWLAGLAVDWLKNLDSDDDWFLWLSFPDPHHPWDPPKSENARCDWRDLPLPDGHPGSPDAIRKVLAQKPAHWLAYYEGKFANIEGGPMNFTPQQLTDDNIREINAKVHVMNELIDEAIGRVMGEIKARGWNDDTDVIFTTDHGELQGDFGFVYKGPWHVDALMRLPFIWRPAPNANVKPATVKQPVEQVDIAATCAAIAGIAQPEWMQGRPLPVSEDGSRQRAFCEWDSQFPGYGFHFRSIYRDGFVLTKYEPSTPGQPNGLEESWPQFAGITTNIKYDGTEGELYNLDADPRQWENLWDDPKHRTLKCDLIADMYDNMPPERSQKLKVEAPA